MYEPLLFIHSWLRWIVLGAIGCFLVRAYAGWIGGKTWTGADNRFIWAFNQAIGYQVLVGIFLYLGVSPFAKMALASPREAFQSAVVAFWVGRHGPTMLAAMAIFQVGKSRADRVPADRRFRAYAIVFTLLAAAILSAIPWPGLVYGRPWIRGFS